MLNKKFFARLILRFILYSYLALFIMMAQTVLRTYILRPIVVNNTYVSEIIGDPIMVGAVKDSLDFFNKLGDNEIISYEPKAGMFSRPVIIVVREFHGFWESMNAGTTFAHPHQCTINLNVEETDPLEFQETVIHEYLHCLYYDHVNNYNDVMFESTTPGYTLDSIKKYAKEVKDLKL